MRNAELEKQGDFDLAVRAVQGIYTYPFCILVLLWTSRFYHDYPIFFGLAAAATCLASLIRGPLIWQRKRVYAWNPRVWRMLVCAMIQTAGGVLGLLMCVSVVHYGFQGWTTLFTMILALGNAYGSIIVLVPRLRWLVVHV